MRTCAEVARQIISSPYNRRTLDLGGRSVLRLFLRADQALIALYDAHAAELVAAAKALSTLMKGLGEGANDLRELAAEIDTIEKRADEFTRQATQHLRQRWLTPFDREEMHELLTAMDDCLDLMQDCAQSVSLYDLKRVSPEARQLADLGLACAERVQGAVSLLPKAKTHGEAILRLCEEIDRLESEADCVMRHAMSRLFRTERDAVHLIKMKAIYELLESITDRCEDVANLMESLVIGKGLAGR
jgi:Phosphate transport regulator (distant homolog of PhoU)